MHQLYRIHPAPGPKDGIGSLSVTNVLFVQVFTGILVQVLTQNLNQERRKSDRLLRNVLPDMIAQELKQNDRVAPLDYQSASVLFTDFVGFTRFAESFTPQQLIEELDGCFRHFDQIAQQHHLEKIKTIGDAYMAVGGLPTPLENHAAAGADLALAMQRETERLAAMHEQPLRMRIGLCTGPVIAGVIGSKKFAYDLWGDTVNLASRMESLAAPGAILVTASTYERLRGRYEFQPGSLLRVKGKGKLLTYRLLGKCSSP